MIQVTHKWIHYCHQFVNISSKAEALSKKKAITRWFFPMPLSYTPQMKVSEEQKCTKTNVEINLCSFGGCFQHSAMWNSETFLDLPSPKGSSVASSNNCRKYVKGSCAFSVIARGACAQRPSSCIGGRKEWGRLRHFSTFLALWHQGTKSPLNLFHPLLIMLLELFGSFFKVMEIMLGNRARISNAKWAERAGALWASPTSCFGLPCCSLGYVPSIWIPGGWSALATNLWRGWRLLSLSHLYLWKILAGNVIILT